METEKTSSHFFRKAVKDILLFLTIYSIFEANIALISMFEKNVVEGGFPGFLYGDKGGEEPI